MRVFYDPAEVGRTFPGSVVTLGNFDGVHLGHRELFRLAEGRAKESGVVWGALTFEPHPAKLLAPSLAPALVSTPQGKLDLISESGPEYALVIEFTRRLAELAPEKFVEQVLVDGLGVGSVVVGYDFTFGTERRGTVGLLRELGRRHGFDVIVADPFSVGGIVVSSTKVRAFVLAGRVYAASLLLGRPFVLSGLVVHGDSRGRSIGFPTANVEVEQELLPAAGVYACWCCLEEGQFPAAVNVGSVPTFRTDGRVTVEAHLLDWQGDLYGRHINIEFVRRLRPERRFGSVDLLIEAINSDVARTREILLKLP